MSEPTNLETREVHGHTFEFISEGMPKIGLHPHWRNTDGNLVLILPPHGERDYRSIWPPYPGPLIHLAGGGDERDAFSMAVTIIADTTTPQHATSA